MLADRYSVQDLKALLPAFGEWHPFPTIKDREAWDNLPMDVRQGYVEHAGANLGFSWPALPASVFLDFKRNGNRSRYEDLHFPRRYMLHDFVIAECIEGEGRFLDDIVNGIWAICEETYWGIPAHVGVQGAGLGLPDVVEPTVDLFASETVALLAFTAYLLGEKLDAVSPLVRERIAYESERRMLEPCINVNFPWMGLTPSSQIVNNWDPWINSNWLVSILLQEQDADRRAEAVHKSLRSLDVFLDMYAEAGGCDEGPGYWGRAAASLFDCLDTLYSATGGKVSFYDEPKVRNMGMFIYRTHIAEDYYVNFADASALTRPPGALIYRYGKRIHDLPMMQFGAWLMDRAKGDVVKPGSNLGRLLPELFDVPVPLDVAPLQPQPRDAWYDGIQVMVARCKPASPHGLFVSAKGGHNNESHNHNDVGNFIVYIDGLPVIVDAGVETYTRKTFSDQRYEIWTMQSSYHTLLPEIDGVQQAPGREFAARDVSYTVDDTRATLRMDIAQAYPDVANLATWQREITLKRRECVDVVDHYILEKTPKTVVFSVLTPCTISVHDGVVELGPAEFGDGLISGAGSLAYDAGKLRVNAEQVAITDTRMAAVWGDHLNRVIFSCDAPEQQGVWSWQIKAR